MAGESPTPPIQRKWTANEPTGPGKWTMVVILAVLLALATGLFFWSVWQRTKARIFVASLHIPDYNDAAGFADPAWPNWDLAEVNSLLEKRGLGQWLIAASAATGQSLDDANEIEQAARATGNWLRMPNGAEPASKKLDTLFYYLRGNCVVFDNQAWLIAGEFSADTLRKTSSGSPATSLPAAIELGKLLDSIADVPARNVIILADICDLVSVPQLGLMANTVPSSIQSICESRMDSKDKQVWVISASASLQHAHVSNLRRRTLLQSASEYALHPDRHETRDNPNTITLDEFYDGVIRYSHKATDGNQTPLLFRYGHKGMIRSDSGTVWKNDARSVIVAYKSGLEKIAKEAAEAEAKKNAGPDANAKTGPGRRPGGSGSRLALSDYPFGMTGVFSTTAMPGNRSGANWASRQEPQQPVTPANPPPVTESAKIGGEKPQDSPGPLKELTDPFLRFWQLRDILNSRSLNGTTGCFAPADFAPKTWRNIQALVARNQRLNSIGPDARAVAEVTKVNSGLMELQNAIAGFTPVNISADGLAGEILQAWNQFHQQISDRKANRSAWSQPSRLPSKYTNVWNESRRRMRAYIDATDRLPAWIEWCRNNPQDIGPVESLAREISSFPIPDISGGSVRDLQRSDLLPIERQLGVLRATVHQRFQVALGMLASGRRITWRDEREYQLLLQSTAAEFPDRLELQSRVATILAELGQKPDENKYTEEPGENDYPVDVDRTMAELLSRVMDDPVSATTRGEYRRWAIFVTETLNSIARTSIVPPGNESVERLNRWATEMQISALQPAPADVANPELVSWLRDCMASISIPENGQAASMNSGAILPVSLDRKLYLESDKPVIAIQGSVGFVQEHPMPVKRGDGSLPERCFIRWDIGPNSPADESTIDRSILFSVEGQPVWRGQWIHAGNLAGEQIILQIRAEVDSSKLPNLPIEVRIASDAQGGGASQPVPLSIIPPNPDRVDLIVARLNPEPGASAEMHGTPLTKSDGAPELDPSGQPIVVLGELSVPAVDGQAKSRYDFQLLNRSSESREVRVRVWAADPPPGLQRAVRGKPAVYRYTPIPSNLVFQSRVISLPPVSTVTGSGESGQAVSKPVRVPLEVSDAATVAAGAAPNSSELGAHGLVVVIEDGKTEAAAGNADGVPTFKPSGKSWQTWVSWQADNPYWDRLVEITPLSADGNLRLGVQVPANKWGQYGIKSLPVEAYLTDASGKKISEPEVVRLNPAASSHTFRLGAGNPSGKVFAHVTIGGYPRAISFSSGLGRAEQPEESEVPFAWLDCEEAVLTTGDPSQNNIRLQKSATRTGLVVPRRIGITGNEQGDQIALSTFQIPFRFDLPEPRNATGAIAKLSLQKTQARAAPPSEFVEDRALFPRWETEEGTVVFSAIATDHLYSLPEIASRTGEFEVRLDVEAAGLQHHSSGILVFDQTDPPRSQISIQESDKRLHLDGSLTIEFSPTDNESSIQQVYFAVAPSGSVDNYSDAAIPLDKVKATFNDEKQVWQQQLSGTSLQGQVPGRWRVLARSVDAAGNFQDQNTAAGFEWTGNPK